MQFYNRCDGYMENMRNDFSNRSRHREVRGARD